MQNQTCAICQETSGTRHVFREMMFGTRDQFDYWECHSCGCLQIVSIPESLAQYYPNDYYSFSQDLNASEAWCYRAYFKAPYLLPLLRRICKNPYFADGKFQAIVHARPRNGARILDVGCGAGHLVKVLRIAGFDAHGIDPYLKTETAHLHKSTLDGVSPGWDLITLNHALEHMSDHIAVLRCAREKLAPNGTCLIRIPVAAWAWKEYGPDWVQLDAPRHLVIHTTKSLRKAAETAGLEVDRVEFDSTIFQYVGSELYKRDIPLSQMEKEMETLSKEMAASLQKRTAELNRHQLGDQASFYLKAASATGARVSGPAANEILIEQERGKTHSVS
jgi:SAM-dependent methyltransferase